MSALQIELDSERAATTAIWARVEQHRTELKEQREREEMAEAARNRQRAEEEAERQRQEYEESNKRQQVLGLRPNVVDGDDICILQELSVATAATAEVERPVFETALPAEVEAQHAQPSPTLSISQHSQRVKTKCSQVFN